MSCCDSRCDDDDDDGVGVDVDKNNLLLCRPEVRDEDGTQNSDGNDEDNKKLRRILLRQLRC